MAQQLAPSSPSSLTLRFISAAVMLPVLFGAIWLGGWFFAVLVAGAATLMYWEWQGLCGEKGGTAIGLAAFCGLATLFSAWVGPGISIVAGVSAGMLLGLRFRRHEIFQAWGFVYILCACISLVWLRNLDRFGMETAIWLGAVVVMTDTCAYFTGRTLGGPKLARKISPNKTWSGLIGGIAGAAVAGGILADIDEPVADAGKADLRSGPIAVPPAHDLRFCIRSCS